MNKKYVFWSVSDLANIARKRREKEFDCIIAFCGSRGNSKSTGAYKIGLELNFKPERDLVYDRDSLLKALEDWEKVIDADEMINSAYKREFYNVDQIELIKLLNMYRDHKHVILLCIPNFWDLDKPLRDLVKIRIDMQKRGFGEVHIPLEMSYVTDSWDMKTNEKIERQWIEKRKKRKPWQLTTFAGYFKFGKLHPDQEAKYKRLKNEARERLRLEKEAKTKEAKEKKEVDFYENLMKLIKEGKMNKDKLVAVCQVSNRKYASVRKQLGDMLVGESKTLQDYLSPKKDLTATPRKTNTTGRGEKNDTPPPVVALNGY